MAIISTMTDNRRKRPISDGGDGGGGSTAQPVRKRDVHYSELASGDQLASISVVANAKSPEEVASYVEHSVQMLKGSRLDEFHQPVYISPIAKANLQAKDEDLFSLMDSVLGFLDSDRQVLLGDSGAGKSTFDRYLEHHLWINYNKDDPIPLFINLPTIDRPDQDIVAKQLRIHDFSDDEIQEIKQNRQLILICDGYNESQLTANLHKANRLNQKDQWRAKVIISCRTQYLGPVYLDRFVPNLRIATPKPTLVEDYVARYVPLERRPWVTEDYMLMLTTIPNLMELVKNPFLLTLTLEALPGVTKDKKELSNIQITRVQLYDHFVNEWLGVNMRRLRDNTLNDDEREMLEHTIEKGFTSLGVDYPKRLALAIFDRHDGNPLVQYIHLDHKNSWKAEFFGPQPEARFLRESSPLARTGSLYRFIHRSMLEYFFSRTVFDPSIHGEVAEFDAQSRSKSSIVHPLDSNGPLFTRSLLAEPSVIQFLCERMKLNPGFLQQLHSIVYQSKTETNVAIAAANAITILVRAEVRFNGADLRDVRIAGADLSGG
ncbi:WD_REPEATS_REGION domain-containing protein [Linnemannia schmuckeri]|uniref:WD_REPEATS_REGION domain-containing protein n=1 Tax=Linnemannia schmuckeri TaxID=64567 RepID=A0A9P5S4Q5_9FUNG|nr:WD_REPEATS_REGION domain-containing protein [Linnemannia schmuckeri]